MGNAIILVFFCLSAEAQTIDALLGIERPVNLVPNPGFEDVTNLHCRWNQDGRKYMEDIPYWDSPTETTPDIFSSKLKPSCWANPKKHSEGKQNPRTGYNMAGIKTYGKGGTETFWHEYLLIKLDSPLVKGQKYFAQMYVNRAVSSSHASDNICMAFLDSAIATRDRMPLYITPQVCSDGVISSRWNMWKEVSGALTAKSNAQYLLIGNTYSDDDTRTEKFEQGQGGAYYYIDDVTVRRATDSDKMAVVPKESVAPRPKVILAKAEIVSTKEIKLDSIDYRPGNIIKLDNIFFEFDKAELLPESRQELDKLGDILFDYPHMVIQISGHTDNIGSSDYNAKLSESRAKAVVDYLIEKGTNKNRLSYQGYGDTRPLATNATPEGRAKNRRVEFLILSN